jgi:GNAT superfamily N-acetyltransferase
MHFLPARPDGSPLSDYLLRPGRPEDAADCGRICYEAFGAIAEAHGFPPDFPSVEVATARMASLLSLAGTRSVVATRRTDAAVVGSVFVNDRWPVASIGPITVDPGEQNRGVGRTLMEDAMAWARDRGFPSIRLVQAAYHSRSLSLYASLGFDAVEPLSVMQGPPIRRGVPGRSVRTATERDVPECGRLCERIQGFARSFETKRAVAAGVAMVAERDGAISGYANGLGFWHHAAAESNEDLEALIDAASVFPGPGFLLPTRNGDLLRWCLERGLQIVMPMTLMVAGSYQEPTGPYLPSICF